MPQVDSILAVADRYDTIVFDQWGVLHNGSTPYPQAVATITALMSDGPELCVLSNSGKRAEANRQRITAMGFPPEAFGMVMTSGEALALDLTEQMGQAAPVLYPITAKPGDAEDWADGLSVDISDDLAAADAVLLMGLPDAKEHPTEQALLDQARAAGMPLICSNPDRASPRAGGVLVQSPGALARAYQEAGGQVTFYGKPHRPIFDALFKQACAQDPSRVLMVGDSLEHDIAGAIEAGWDSLFIQGGIGAGDPPVSVVPDQTPTYTLSTLR